MSLRRAMAVCLVASLLTASGFAGLGSDKTKYIGGTVNLKEGAEGKSSTKDAKVFLFDAGTEKLEIPYDKVDSLEYGQTAGRRVGVRL